MAALSILQVFVADEIIRTMTINYPAELEREVQRIASALWGKRPGDALPEIVAGRERDCIFRGEEVIHYIECTMQRSLSKVESDARKMVTFRDAEMRKGNVVKLWYVTASDPTADQVTAARQNGIKILSLHNFRLQLLDGDAYLGARKSYRWGSATNPKDESPNIESVVYQRTTLYDKRGTEKRDIASVAQMLRDGRVVTLLATMEWGRVSPLEKCLEIWNQVIEATLQARKFQLQSTYVIIGDRQILLKC